MSIFDIFHPQDDKHYIISETAFPCPEHNGEHMIERAVAETDEIFLSVTKHDDLYQSVVCQDMDEPIRHTETLSSNLEETVSWLSKIFGE